MSSYLGIVQVKLMLYCGARRRLMSRAAAAARRWQLLPLTSLRVFTLAASSEKRNVTVWRPSVCPSTCLSRRRNHRFVARVAHVV